MKYILKACIFICCLFVVASTADAQDVTIRRITDRVIVLSMSNMGMHTAITVIESQKGLVVIETEITPYVMSKIKEAAQKELGRDDWAYVINTHGHLHHAGGNSVFQGVQIIGHETMNMDWLKDRLSTNKGRGQYCDIVGVNTAIRLLRRNLFQAMLTPAQKKELRRKLSFCNAVKQEIMSGFEVVNPSITFRQRYALDLGDVHLRLIYWGDGINHSSIFVHVVEDNLLVGMGMGKEWMPSFYGKTSLAGILHAISVMKEISDENLQIDYMIGVHSPELITGREQFKQREIYLQTLLDDLTQAQQQGLSLGQAKAEFSLDERHAHLHKYFSKPQNLEERHRKNIEMIWKLLQQQEGSSSLDQ